MSDATQFLEWLFGTNPPGLIWIGGHGDGFKGRTFATPADAGQYARALDDSAAGGVYFRLTLTKPISEWAPRPDGREAGRGAAEDSSHLVAFAADLDLEGPGHKAAKLPRPASDEQLREILADAGVPDPTAWVHSGGGRYAFWKMIEPIDLADSDVFATAQQRSAALHASIIGAARSRGLKIDNTRDLARIYRLPGTHNRKGVEGGEQPRVARVLSSDGPKHTFYAFRAPAAIPGDSSGIEETPGHDVGDSVAAAPAFAATALFGGGSEVAEKITDVTRLRTFTVGQAMGWVAPFLGALRNAPVGSINVALNDAALALAHFGPEFWSREAAEKQLYDALGATAYDGATWQAGDTIRSAYDAMAARADASGGLGGEYWRAVLVLDAPGQVDAGAALASVSGDDVDALLAEMLDPEDLINRPPPRHMIRGLLTFDSEAWLIGPPGSKKSFVALDLACHVANGMAWQGRKVQQARVVIIAAEGGGGIGKRLNAWQRTYGPIAAGQVKVLTRPVQAQDVAAWAVLVKACERLEAGFVIIDTQARVTVGLEENSAKDMGVYVNAARMIKGATGACVMTVHHTGRRGGDARGSSAIDGAQDTELKIEPVRRSYARLKVDKQKDIEPIEPVRLKFERVTLGQDEEGDTIDSLVVVRHDAWSAGEIDDESFDALDAEAAKEVTPFMVRSEPEEWTKRVTPSRAVNQRWVLQALADAGDYGLTSSQMRTAVEGKIGRKFVRKDEWDVDTFKIVNNSASPAVVAGVVVQVPGTARWTVDRMAIEALLK